MSPLEPGSITIATAATLACIWEATASKPGNVNRLADFEDLTLVDFLNSATVIGQAINELDRISLTEHKTEANSLGSLVLRMVQNTSSVCQSNSNLGICLLLAPLAMAAFQSRAQGKNCGCISISELQRNLSAVLAAATVADTRQIYHAIGIANPGGLGNVKEADVRSQDLHNSDTPKAVMQLAADRDSIAAEYSTDFSLTFATTVPWIRKFTQAGYPLRWTIVGTFLGVLSRTPDTLILRKLGMDVARRVSESARQIREIWFAEQIPPWNEFQTSQEPITAALADFDFHLRSDGHRRNPGTTADLIAAGLFVGLLTGEIQPSQKW